MKLTIFIIFWVLGIIVAFIGNENIRHWKYYVNPKTCLVLNSIFCLLMSWVLVVILFVEGEFELPKRLFHSCRSCYKVRYVEEYLDEDGNPTEPDKCKVRHTYRVYTCDRCGKEIEREQLQ